MHAFAIYRKKKKIKETKKEKSLSPINKKKILNTFLRTARGPELSHRSRAVLPSELSHRKFHIVTNNRSRDNSELSHRAQISRSPSLIVKCVCVRANKQKKEKTEGKEKGKDSFPPFYARTRIVAQIQLCLFLLFIVACVRFRSP